MGLDHGCQCAAWHQPELMLVHDGNYENRSRRTEAAGLGDGIERAIPGDRLQFWFSLYVSDADDERNAEQRENG